MVLKDRLEVNRKIQKRDRTCTLDEAAAETNLDLRRRLRVLNLVGASRRGARPRPPRDGGALPETRRPRLGRPEREAVRIGSLGRLARRHALLRRRGDQRLSSSRHGSRAAAPTVCPARDQATRGPLLRLHRCRSWQAPRRRTLLRAAPRRVPVITTPDLSSTREALLLGVLSLPAFIARAVFERLQLRL